MVGVCLWLVYALRAAQFRRKNQATVESLIELTSDNINSKLKIIGCDLNDLEDIVLGTGFVSETLNSQCRVGKAIDNGKAR